MNCLGSSTPSNFRKTANTYNGQRVTYSGLEYRPDNAPVKFGEWTPITIARAQIKVAACDVELVSPEDTVVDFAEVPDGAKSHKLKIEIPKWVDTIPP